MMKKILSLFIIFLLQIVVCNTAFAGRFTPVAGNNFDERPIKLAQGTFLRATMQRELSTATNRMGDEVRMIAISPTFAADALLIPENSIYVGEIIEINQPIEGVNASMRVNFNKIIFPSGDEMSIDAVLYSKNHNLIGGELPPPAYYLKIPHFSYGFRGGYLGFQNSGIYQVGVPTIIKAGAEMVIMLNQDTDFYRYEI